MESRNLFRTWLEIDKKAILHNIAEFRKVIKPKTKFMAVVKSNAYGHGLIDFARTVENKTDWFGVDSITDGLKLRRKGLKKPILVLGYTLPSRLEEAAQNDISLTVSSFEALDQILKLKNPPKVHLKIDTGMHRQGFLVKDMPRVVKLLKRFKILPTGIYTHFASAKDRFYPHYSLNQMEIFKKADRILKKAGFQNYLRHVAASAGALLYPNAHFNMVRIGISLYGMFSTKEIESQISLPDYRNREGLKINLKPVLSWKSIIGEIKDISKGSFIGYDLTEKIARPTKAAVIPIGYWHGFDRGLSSIGEVLIKGKRCKILGRVSMDMIVIDITNVDDKFNVQSSKFKTNDIKVGDEVVIIGKSGEENITAEDIAQKIGTISHEIVTRINPLIKRIYI